MSICVRKMSGGNRGLYEMAKTNFGDVRDWSDYARNKFAEKYKDDEKLYGVLKFVAWMYKGYGIGDGKPKDPACMDCGFPRKWHERECGHGHVSYPGKDGDGLYRCDDYKGPGKTEYRKMRYEEAKKRGFDYMDNHQVDFIDCVHGPHNAKLPLKFQWGTKEYDAEQRRIYGG